MSPRRTVALALALLLACACREEEAAPARPEAERAEHEAEHADEVTLSPEAIAAEGIELARAEPRTLRPTFRVPARIAFNAERMAHVGSPVRGRVRELVAKLGDAVERGDALLVIESPELGEAQSEYLRVRGALLTAAPPVELARDAFERGRALHEESGSVALAEVKRREAELRAAEGALRAAEVAEQAARDRLALLGMEPDAIERVASEGRIDPRYALRATLSGEVIGREVTLGELVGPEREALLVVADLDHLWVLADVPEGRLAEVRVGAPARVHIGSDEDHWCDGTVSYVSPSVDPATRTVHVRIEANDRHPELRPGVFAQAEIATASDAEPAPVLAVPEGALLLVEGEPSVFVAVPGEPGTFARRAVTAGEPVEGFVPILAGLAAGEEVVARGAFVLKAELGKGAGGHGH